MHSRGVPPSRSSAGLVLTPANEGSRPIAAVDLGSNSIHLTLARVHVRGDTPRVEVFGQHKDAARLAAHIGPDRQLSAEGIGRAVATLARFRRIADDHGAEIRTAATAAMRAARNASELVERAALETGISLEIISGAEEARLVYLGALHGLPSLHAQKVICVDVGGGSTEILLGLAGRPLLVASLPLGSVVVTRDFLEPDPLRPRVLARARARLRERLKAHVAGLKHLGFERAVGTGGTMQRVARMAKALRTGDPRGDLNGQILSTVELHEIISALAHASRSGQRLRLPGIDPERESTLLGGALVFEALTEGLALPSWTVSTAALRLGLVVDTWLRRSHEGVQPPVF